MMLTGILNVFEAIDIEGPKFVFAHLTVPHPPYVFGKKLSFIHSIDGSVGRTNKNSYVLQVRALNEYVKKIISDILAKSTIPPIIVLQADHGSSIYLEGWNYATWNQPSDIKLKERYGILNVYNLPDGGDKLLYENISPVNSFRVIFNYYFGTHYPLLKDVAYYFYKTKLIDNNYTINEWVDVTDILDR